MCYECYLSIYVSETSFPPKTILKEMTVIQNGLQWENYKILTLKVCSLCLWWWWWWWCVLRSTFFKSLIPPYSSVCESSLPSLDTPSSFVGGERVLNLLVSSFASMVSADWCVVWFTTLDELSSLFTEDCSASVSCAVRASTGRW